MAEIYGRLAGSPSAWLRGGYMRSPVTWTWLGLALLLSALAALGLYGILAWSVGARRRELGVRAALGADRQRLARDVINEAVPLVAAGGTVGGLAGWWSARLLGTILYDVQPTAIEAWIATALVVSLTAAVAVAIPSRRACMVSPADALRMDA